MITIQRDINEIINSCDFLEQLKNARILVTGATGLVGSMVIKTLVEANIELKLGLKVYGYIRDYNKADLVFSNIKEKIELISSLDVKCDYIIHTISPTKSRFFIEHPVETIKSSVETTISVLDHAKNNNANVIYLSSMEQYGVPYIKGQHMTEECLGYIDHLNIRSSYSEAKRLCECLCVSYASEYRINVKIARLAQTFGAGIDISDSRMPMQFAKSVVNNSDIVLHTEGKSISNFVYLSDAIAGIFTILCKGEIGQAYNISNDNEVYSVFEIASLVSKEIADGKISVKIQKQENMGYAPDVEMYLVSEKLRKLGWCPKVSLIEAYNRLIEYIKETV